MMTRTRSPLLSRILVLVVVLALVAPLWQVSLAAPEAVVAPPAAASGGGVMFIENVGQFAADARYQVWGGRCYVADGGGEAGVKPG